MLAVLLFAVAVSIDGFAAGVAEGLRGIRVPFGSLVAMNVVSAAVVFVSVGCGRAISGFLTPVAGRLIGGVTLMALGAWTLFRRRAPGSAPAALDARRARTRTPSGWRGRVAEPLVFVTAVLEEPARADLDSSGTITSLEALLLGLALALDALTVGFGAGMAGLPTALTPLVACVTQTVFVSAGISLGRRVKTSAVAPGLEKVPGGLLILLGLMRLM
ncbi:MAG: sporulation membrane protein YtaF [Firmicutes bacterium]|nr:sporulation membrane protein YtaF [Bacillota bacterium]MDH7496759.1 sporulation membrane protein YtaF [Bacillota bacterium]